MDIFGICEAFLDEFSIESNHVDSYQLFHVRRSMQKKDGLGVFIKSYIPTR